MSPNTARIKAWHDELNAATKRGRVIIAGDVARLGMKARDAYRKDAKFRDAVAAVAAASPEDLARLRDAEQSEPAAAVDAIPSSIMER